MSLVTGVENRHPMLANWSLAPFVDYGIDRKPLDFSLYYIDYYYLKDLVILKIPDNPIVLQNKIVFGMLFSDQPPRSVKCRANCYC